MKLMKQHDERDCGAACLAMILRHYGVKIPLSKCRIITKTDQEGTNLFGIIEGAKQFHLDGQALEGSSRELFNELQNGQIKLPLIARIVSEEGYAHFVVVAEVNHSKEYLQVCDPAHGRVRMSFSEFGDIYTGYVVAFLPAIDFEKADLTKGTFAKFFKLLRGQNKLIASVIVLSAILAVMGILGTLSFEVVIDRFIYSDGNALSDAACHDEECNDATHVHEHEIVVDEGTSKFEIALSKSIETVVEKIERCLPDIASVSLALLSLYFLSAIMQWIRGKGIVKLAVSVDVPLVIGFHSHVIDLPIEAFGARNTGEIMARFSDADCIRNAVSNASLALILDTVMAIFGGIVLFGISSRLFVIAAAIFALYAICVVSFRQPLHTVNQAVMESNAKVTSFLKESIDGIETIKAACAENAIKAQTQTKYLHFINKVARNSLYEVSQQTLLDLIESAGVVALLWVGVTLILMQKVTLGELITFYAILSFFLTPLKNLVELQPTMQQAIVAADRLNDLLDIDTENIQPSKKDRLDKNIRLDDIQFFHVDFRYGNRPLTLRDVSFSIIRGTKTAIVGESGSGKTTIAKLLLMFYTPENGCIKISDRPLSQYGIEQIRQRIAYVSQDTFLFADTIYNNLVLGVPNVTETDVVSACKQCAIHEYIESLPNAYQTMLDENGDNLSGGQKQRLALARALLRKPDVLILDEATSNLDSITESGIHQAIASIEEQVTCLIIAHRLSTVKSCDQIIVIEQGTVKEVGTHEELIQAKTRYSEYWSRQLS